MKNKVKFGIVQMIINKSCDENLFKALKYLKKLSPFVDFVVFPEYFLGWDKNIFNNTIKIFKKEAKKYKINIILGSLIEKRKKKLYNTTAIIDKNGHMVGKYRKMHPYVNWEKNIVPGKKSPIFNVGDMKICIATCLDIYFPLDIKRAVSGEADILFIPTLTDTKEFPLHVCVARTRAVENLIPILMVNSVGKNYIGQWQIWAGNSLLIGPDGNIITQMKRTEGFKIAKINLLETKKIRKKLFNVFKIKTS